MKLAQNQPAFQTTEFFIMVTGKNEVNLFPGTGGGKMIMTCLPKKAVEVNDKEPELYSLH